jgi:hypothetical protein
MHLPLQQFIFFSDSSSLKQNPKTLGLGISFGNRPFREFVHTSAGFQQISGYREELYISITAIVL